MTLTEDLLKKEKERLSKEYREKLEAINRLIDVYGEAPRSSLSDTERTKQALRTYEGKAYKITELMEMLQMEGIDVTRSIVHQALKQLRESGDIVAFRLNGSNQSVYYMTPDGKDDSQELYPVAPDFRPNDVNPQHVDKFEWLD